MRSNCYLVLMSLFRRQRSVSTKFVKPKTGKRRGVNGRAKGSTFERQIAHMVVTAFLPFGITNKDCYRTPLSGGHIHASGNDPGDLVISPKLERIFPISVECKSYKKLDWPKLLCDCDGHWLTWYRQARKASKGLARTAMLVFKQNMSEPFAMINMRKLKDLTDNGVLPNPKIITCVRAFGEVVVVMPFREVLNIYVQAAKKV